jgi:LmbE family N-acetylglucosaminyl deacetylase
MRRTRPRVMLAPLDRDLHPDHEATGLLARRAYFHAGLVRFRPELGSPHRPELLLHYPLHNDVAPTLCVDIAAVADRKLDAIRCYATQFGAADRSHLARMELTVAMEEWHRLIPQYHVKAGETPEYSIGIREVKYLPLQWDAA